MYLEKFPNAFICYGMQSTQTACTTDDNQIIISYTYAPLQLCIVTPNHNLQLHWWWA